MCRKCLRHKNALFVEFSERKLGDLTFNQVNRFSDESKLEMAGGTRLLRTSDIFHLVICGLLLGPYRC